MDTQIKFREKVGYGLGDAASSMFWKLFGSYLLFFYTDIFGLPAAAVGKEADFFTLEFNAADTMVAGRTNCNRFFGKYELKGKELELKNLGMTRMACPEMQYEDAFVKMLDEVDGYEIKGEELKFYDDKKLLAEFRAVQDAAAQKK